MDSYVVQGSAVLYGLQMRHPEMLLLCGLKCSSPECNRLLPYDGLADGIFVPSGPEGGVTESVYAIEVMMGFIHALKGAKISYRGYHETLVNTYTHAGQDPPPWSTFLRALLSFILLYSMQLDVKSLFSCPVCCELPDSDRLVIVDGITLGIKRAKFRAFTPAASDERLHTSLKADKDCFITKPAKARKLLRKLGSTSGIERASFERLAASIHGTSPGHEGARLLVAHLWEDGVVHLKDDFFRVQGQHTREFIKGLTMEQPASGLWHPTLGLSHEDLQAIMWSTGPLTRAQQEQLRCGFPQLHRHLLAIRKPGEQLYVSSHLRSLVLKFADVATAADRQVTRDAPLAPVEGGNPYAAHVLAPTRPFVRLPRLYEQDNYEPLGSRSVLGKRNEAAAEDEGSSRCNKVSLKHKIFTPGVMHFSCPHGITELAYLMPRFEGPTVAFEMLFTHYLKAPKMIVYDNACNLHVSCNRREPLFFSQSKYVSDRMHWPDHTNCSSGYSLNALDQNMVLIPSFGAFPPLTVRDLNSQVSEQLNRKLQSVRTQMSFMSHDNFVSFLKVFLAMHNEAKRSELFKKAL